MNNLIKNDFYDLLCTTIENCVKEVSINTFKKYKKILIIGTNIRTKMRNLLTDLYRVNPQVELIIIAQEQMVESFTDLINEKSRIIKWHGPYGEKLVELLREQEDFFKIDSMIYFCAQAVSLRDINILQIAGELNKIQNISLYSVDTAEELYEYKNLALYSMGIALYQNINDFIEQVLSEKEQ
ncbi:MAG: hypothetical protein NC314_07110 [Roseburia sp.]|nr:hypothetical protein [Roseburia sp.]